MYDNKYRRFPHFPPDINFARGQNLALFGILRDYQVMLYIA
jgi:hypothetical protein